MPAVELTKPDIRILCGPGTPEEILLQLRFGMEEEGIPWQTETRAGGDAAALAWEAAQSSRLEVGVGLDAQSLVLHYSKLAADEPLFRVSVRGGAEQARALGANAARLVKKLPLKPLRVNSPTLT